MIACSTVTGLQNYTRLAMLGQCLTAQMTLDATAFTSMSSLEYAYFHYSRVKINPQVLNKASFPTGPSISNGSRLPSGDDLFDPAEARHLI